MGKHDLRVKRLREISPIGPTHRNMPSHVWKILNSTWQVGLERIILKMMKLELIFAKGGRRKGYFFIFPEYTQMARLVYRCGVLIIF